MSVYDDGTLLQASYDFPGTCHMSKNTVEDVLVPFQKAVESYGGQFYYMNKYPRHLFFWDGFPYHTGMNTSIFIQIIMIHTEEHIIRTSLCLMR